MHSTDYHSLEKLQFGGGRVEGGYGQRGVERRGVCWEPQADLQRGAKKETKRSTAVSRCMQ